MQRAIHIISFGRVYGRPKRSNVFTGVYVSILIVSAVIALKYFTFSIAYMVALTASLACVSWIYQNNRHTIKNGLVGNILTQLVKRPLAYSCSKLLTFFNRRKTDAFQIFKGNPFAFFFGNLNNLFGNRVVDYRNRGTFSTREPFQKSFTSFCAFALNGVSYFLSFFSIILKFFRVESFSITKCGNRHQTKIHPDKFLYVLNILFGYVNGLKKVKLSFFVNQISLAFNVRNVIRVMADKFDFLPTTDTPQRNHIVRLVGHYPAVVSNTAKWPENTFCFLVQLIGIGNFGYLPYNHLRRKFKRSLVSVIYFVMELKVVENLFLPSHIGNGVTNGIGLLHRIEKQIRLFIGRQKFDFQCQLHSVNIQIVSYIRKKLSNKGDSCFPPVHASDERVSAVVL